VARRLRGCGRRRSRRARGRRGGLDAGQRRGLRGGQQTECFVRVAGELVGLGRGERAARPDRRVGREHGGAVEECRRGRVSAPGLGVGGRAFQLARDLLVGAGRRLCPVPRPAVAVDRRVRDRGERAVRLAALRHRRRPVDGRADEGMAERHPGGRPPEQVLQRRGVRVVGGDVEQVRRAPQQGSVAERLCGRHQRQTALAGRQLTDPAPEAVLDAGGQTSGVVRAQAGGELGVGQTARQLQDRQRIPLRLGDDPVAHPRVQRPADDRVEQRLRVGRRQAPDRHLRDPGQREVGIDASSGEHQGDRLRRQTAGDEPEHLGRGLVEPLRVVHEAHERTVGGCLGEQAEHRQPEQEPVRCGAVLQAEGRAQRVRLRLRDGAEVVEQR